METVKIPCKKCGALILPGTAEKTDGLCRPCERKANWPKQPLAQSEPDPGDRELSPENAHPKARQVLTDSFFWQLADDGAPLGSDTGSDLFAMYRTWKDENPTASPRLFLAEVLREWEVPNKDWQITDPNLISKKLAANGFFILTRDDTVIALAFSQIILDGILDTDIKEKALLALKRQSLDTVITYRGWVDSKERKERVERMRMAIEAF
jgi:uncharacterized protein YfeS